MIGRSSRAQQSIEGSVTIVVPPGKWKARPADHTHTHDTYSPQPCALRRSREPTCAPYVLSLPLVIDAAAFDSIISVGSSQFIII